MVQLNGQANAEQPARGGALAHIAEPLRTLAVPVDSLNLDPSNARTHPEKNLAAIKASLARFGQRQPVVVQREGMVVRAGNGRVMAARALGWTHVAALVVDESAIDATAFAIADNRTSDLAEWDDGTLARLLESLPSDLKEAAGYDDKDMKELLASLGGDVVEDEAPEPLPDPVSRRGDLWVMGGHRILCGDSTDGGDVALCLNGAKPDCILTDPPYCSGGFQEAGRSAGSVGTDAEHIPIANDRLSTRGWSAMLKAAFGNIGAKYIYVFTDWRMWVHLFDLVESCGFCVRSMIVWDKGTPGMGRGWRCQHELVMWGCKETAPFDKHASGQGNVLACKRTGNENHTTEKPVPLLAAMLVTTPFIESVYDPFMGSGSSMIACEQLGRSFFGTELSPMYVDVAVRRWQKLTGKDATHADTGKTWAETAAERGVKTE